MVAGILLGILGAIITILPMWAGAIVLAGAIGAGKEIWDARTGLGTPEYMDFVYTLGGGCVAAIVIAML